MNLNQITKDALSLSVRERGLLAAHLLASIDAKENNEHQTAWLDRAEARLRGLDEGRAQPVSEEEVAQRIRAHINNSQFLIRNS